MKKVYICSPYRADDRHTVKGNLWFAEELCTMALLSGYAPIAPHLIYPRCLDDNDSVERQIGLNAAREWIPVCDELWQGGEKISEGMAAELELAKRADIPIRIISRDGDNNE